MNYLEYWSLSRSPFQSGEPETFYSGSSQREALAGLSLFASSEWKLAFLVSPPRCGTTSLLQQLDRMGGLGNVAIDSVITIGNQTHPDQVLATLRRALGYRTHVRDPKTDVDAVIRSSDRRGLRTVWLIDSCNPPTITLASEMVQRHRRLSVVAATRPEFRSALNSAAGMCGMQIDLEPWTLSDTHAFIQQGLRSSNGMATLFSEHAITRLHQITKGIVGEVSVVAESCLALAAQYQLRQVTPAIIDATMEISHLWQAIPATEPVEESAPSVIDRIHRQRMSHTA